jgi:hypothetical protein
MQAKVAFEQQLAKGVTGAVDVTYINTTRIARQRNVNLPAASIDALGRDVFVGPGPYVPTYGFAQATESSAKAAYRGLTASLIVRRTAFTVDAYYTLSRTRSQDDTERGISGIVYDDAANMASEWSDANIDQRHQFSANGVFFLPAKLEISPACGSTAAARLPRSPEAI